MTGADDGIFFAFRVYNSIKPNYGLIDTSYYRLNVINIVRTIDEESGS